jgi:hypothetical protein
MSRIPDDVTVYCCRCGKPGAGLHDLCEKCYDKFRDKFDELSRSYPTDEQKKILEKEYGTKDACEAYIRKRFGRGRRTHRCSGCGKTMSQDSQSTSEKDAWGWYYYCPSCQKKQNQRAAEIEKEKAKDFKRNFGDL